MFWSDRPLETLPFHDVAVELLRRQIHLGVLRPEEKLPPERLFAENLGISRVTLREALGVLDGLGYLTIRRRGTFVVTASELNSVARRHLSSDPARAWRSVEFLKANFVAAAEAACKRWNPSDIAEMNTRIATLMSASEPADLREFQSKYFLAVATASKSEYFRNAIQTALEGLFHPITAQQFERYSGRFVHHAGKLKELFIQYQELAVALEAGGLMSLIVDLVQEGMTLSAESGQNSVTEEVAKTSIR